MLYHEEDYKGYHIKIKLDDLPENPRQWDNLGTMACFHRNYNLGDDKTEAKNDFEHLYCDVDDIRDIEDSSNVIALPLYLYDHSGITMNTTGFYCQWDSFKVGFIYVTKNKLRKEYGWKRITKQRIKQVEEHLRNEVEVYDQYICGDVYGYEITKDDKDIDQLWGMFGYDYTLEEAKRYIDSEFEQTPVQLELPFVQVDSQIS